MKKIVVISLGGSIIIPDEINKFILEKFKKILNKNTNKYKFVVVCGGGKTARNYIDGFSMIPKKEYYQTLFGIAATRLNAKFMTAFVGSNANKTLPKNMEDIEDYLAKHDIVFCGALRYGRHETSDSTAVKLAHFFDSDFINITNVQGVYDKDPKLKNSKYIPEISHDDFYKMAKKIHYKPGQHFIRDQTAAELIKKNNIRTFILGPDIKQLDNLLNEKHFVGTIIES